jgi:hypothetical protein
VVDLAIAAQLARAEDLAMREPGSEPGVSRRLDLTSTLARAEVRMWSAFDRAGVVYPPRFVTLVALKKEGRMELWADGGLGWRFVRSYLVRPASGRLGPKLRQGDRQVPEGLYRITRLNPQSNYHLSMKLDYPNGFDRARANADRRLSPLGGDIMIHGGNASVGCLPVGDSAIEELYALASRLGPRHVSVIVSPLDLRRTSVELAVSQVAAPPPWIGQLYGSIAVALASFPLPEDTQAVPILTPPLAYGRAKCKPYDAADCTERCDDGDAPSCAIAGLMYRDGRGASTDAAKAWTLLRKACAGGDALGCAELSVLHLEDDGLRRDVGQAAELAHVACDSGAANGCTYLANLCIDRVGYPETRETCSKENVERLREKAGALGVRAALDQRAASIAGVMRTRKSWTGSSARPVVAQRGK